MSKIAIISQPDQGVLIDLGGCVSLTEATHHLTSTLQISSDFWHGVNVDLNLGRLALSREEVGQIMAIAAEVGVKPSQVFAENPDTRLALQATGIPIGRGIPMKLPQTPAEEQFGPDDAVADAPADAAAFVVEGGEPAGEASVEQTETAPGTQEPGLVATTSGEAGLPPDAVDRTANFDGDPGSAGIPPAAERAGLPRPQLDSTASAQSPPPQPVVLYLRQTLRSGQAISHKGHLVIIGDVNPGAEVMAEGDITVWGALRGIAHAGIGGNIRAEIRALRLQPVQLRIAHAIARSPDRPRKSFSTHSGPETARIVNGTIRITASNPD
ncbi:MAG TPA: septum site-determining protein MinC [Candidatus Obscuribacterales bacterium]